MAVDHKANAFLIGVIHRGVDYAAALELFEPFGGGAVWSVGQGAQKFKLIALGVNSDEGDAAVADFDGRRNGGAELLELKAGGELCAYSSIAAGAKGIGRGLYIIGGI